MDSDIKQNTIQSDTEIAGKDQRHREQNEQRYVDMKVNGLFREEYVEKLVRNWADRYVDAGLWKNCKTWD